MADYIGMFAISQLETNGNASWIGIGIKVGDVGDSGGVGESHPDGGGGVIEMGARGELRGFGRGCEGSGENYSFGMSCKETCQ